MLNATQVWILVFVRRGRVMVDFKKLVKTIWDVKRYPGADLGACERGAHYGRFQEISKNATQVRILVFVRWGGGEGRYGSVRTHVGNCLIFVFNDINIYGVGSAPITLPGICAC